GYYIWASSDSTNFALYLQRMPVYQCPSDDRPTQFPNMRNYFGVTGGRDRTTYGWRGDIFTDGMFTINHWRRFADIRDGTSATLAIGESVHNAFYGDAQMAGSSGTGYSPGLGPGYADPSQGSPCAWVAGDGCNKPNCPMSTWSVGRGLRSTKWPINHSLFDPTMAANEENDAPFGSFHSGGAHFVFADGHVGFLNDTIDFATYQYLSTIEGR
ncbi:unnamed protein product, partial [marine sediment metagenome]